MAKTLARIAESGFLWEVFRKSKWFPYSSIEDGRIREALTLLDREIERMPQGRSDTRRKRKARERLVSVLAITEVESKKIVVACDWAEFWNNRLAIREPVNGRLS